MKIKDAVEIIKHYHIGYLNKEREEALQTLIDFASKVPKKKEEVVDLIGNMTRDGYGIHAIGENIYKLFSNFHQSVKEG